MSKKHVVKHGEHLSSLAKVYGFAHYLTIWEHPANAALRARRENPHILVPGDEVLIPDRTEKTVQVPAGKLHTFQVADEILFLRVRFRDPDNELLPPGTPCLVVQKTIGDRGLIPTNADGIVEDEIPRDLERCEMVFGPRNIKMDLRIGKLEPPDTLRGQRARLNNLGYFAGFSETELKQFRWAAEEFKTDKGIKPLAEPIDFIFGIKNASFFRRLEKEHGS